MEYKKYIRLLPALLTAVLALAACSDKADAPAFGISETELTFAADGGTYAIDLTAGEDWTVSCDREWCLVSPANGDGSTRCEIRVDSSYLYSAREAHLNFRCGTYSRMLTVSQFGYEKVIRLEKTEIKVPDYTEYDGLFEIIRVDANVGYDVTVEYADKSRAGWLRVHPMPGKVQSVPRPGTVRIDYDMYMESDRDRVATIVFRQNDAKEGETPVESRLTFRQTHAQEIIPSREGDSLALLALSRIMHLAENWDAAQPMMYWNNIRLEDVTYYNAKLQRTVTEPRVVEARFSMFSTDEGIPYQVQFLDQLRVFALSGNANAHMKDIDLGEYVTRLRNLRALSLVGYGISRLPDSMAEMTNLEELELSGNNFTTLPMGIIKALDKHKLWYVNFANNRRRDVYSRLYDNRSVRDTLGLHGALPQELFELKNVAYIGLSYNYFEGSLPDMGYDASQYATLEEKIAHNPVMPQLEQLSVNLNFLTGPLPDWILYHKNLRCWDPYTLVFNQYEGGRDSKGSKVGFTNEPAIIEQACPLWYDDEDKDEGGRQEAKPFNRANTFDPAVKYDMLRFGMVTR